MIRDEHDVAGVELRVEPTGRVGEHHRLDAQREDCAQEQRGLAMRMPLVRVGPPGQHDGRRAAHRSRHQLAGVAGDGRCGDVRDLAVWDSDAWLGVEQLDDATKARPKHDRQSRRRQRRVS